MLPDNKEPISSQKSITRKIKSWAINRAIKKALAELIHEENVDAAYQTLSCTYQFPETARTTSDSLNSNSETIISRTYNSMKNALSDRDSKVLVETLQTLAEKCFDPDDAAKIISQKFPKLLYSLLNSKEDFVREKSLFCLRKLYGLENLKDSVIDLSLLQKLKDMMHDNNQAVRVEVALFLERISVFYSLELINLGFIPVLLRSVNNESDDILHPYLKTLKLLINRAEKNDILSNWKSWKIFQNLLENENPIVISETLECISELVSTSVGKCMACEGKLLNKIVSLISLHNDQRVSVNASKVIMLATDGGLVKFRFKKNSAFIKKLIQLCNLPYFYAQLYAINALTHICEHSIKSRGFVFQNHLTDLENISVRKDQALSLHKKFLLDVVKRNSTVNKKNI